jgi:16S rRNA G966 N2-methylase RsmD
MVSESEIQGELLIFRLPNARRKAIRSAVMEATTLLEPLGAKELSNGPFGVQGGLFYIELPRDVLKTAIDLIPRLGYTALVEKVKFADQREQSRISNLSRWKGRYYSLVPIYEADQAMLRDQAPDRREFLLPSAEGELRKVVGYRGDSGKLRRRGLPVIDSRLLVNLAFSGKGKRFLDPFAGAGGVVIEAVKSGYETYSIDVDPFVMYGLHSLALHSVADAHQLPFPNGYFESIGSEPPYDEEATEVLCQAIAEMDRVLKAGGSVALMVADHQVEPVLGSAAALSWRLRLHEHIDRKGLPVTALSWRKPKPKNLPHP